MSVFWSRTGGATLGDLLRSAIAWLTSAAFDVLLGCCGTRIRVLLVSSA